MAAESRPAGEAWLGLTALFLIAVVSYVDRNLLSVVLQPIKTEFALSDRMLGLLGGAPFAICYAIFGLPLGRLADRWDAKAVLLWSLCFWTAMTGVTGFAASLAVLFLARMGVGIGESGATPSSHAMLAELFPATRRGLAFSILTAASPVGAAIALIGGGWLAVAYGWRAAFLGAAALSLPVLIAALLLLPRRLGHSAEPDLGGESAWRSVRALFAKRSFAAATIGLTVYAFFTFGMLTWTPTYLNRTLALDLREAGLVFGIATTLGTLVGTFAGGLAVDRLVRRDPRWLLWIPAIGIGATCPFALLAFASAGALPFAVFASIFVALLSAGVPSVLAAAQFVCGPRRRALASAIIMAALNGIGLTLAPLITGVLSDLYAGWGDALSLRHALMSVTVFTVIAALIFLYGARFIAADAVSEEQSLG